MNKGDDQIAQRCKDLRSRTRAQARAIFAKGHVAHIMGAVFNAPMLADCLSAVGGRQDGVANEPGSLAGRPPEPGRGRASKNVPSDADNGPT